MTDEAKALVERLRGDWPEILVEKHWMMDSDAIDKQREEAADLIETQAREIERLNAILSEMNDTDVIARTMAENERLRSVDISWSETGEWCAEAADRIERLEAALLMIAIPRVGGGQWASEIARKVMGIGNDT